MSARRTHPKNAADATEGQPGCARSEANERLERLARLLETDGAADLAKHFFDATSFSKSVEKLLDVATLVAGGNAAIAPVDEILRVLVETNPQLVVCYPSHLRQIAEMASQEQIERIRPLLVSVSSEMSSQSERDVLSEIFGCPVLDNYSSEEMARIASQCSEKSYHVFEDMNYIETVGGDGSPTDGLGKIVATNLHNFAVPLIRYEQNDLAELEAPGCACGRNFRRLRNLQGRQNDSFTMPSGRVLTSGFLLDATYEFLLTHRTAIRDFCLVQESVDSVLLEIVAGAGWSDSVERQIAERFREFLDEGMRFRIETVEECEKTRTGKRNPIINRSARASGAVIPH